MTGASRFLGSCASCTIPGAKILCKMTKKKSQKRLDLFPNVWYNSYAR